MIQQLGILGYPLTHSLSPVMHQAALDWHSLPVRYNAWSTPPRSLAGAVEGLRNNGYLGANVTIPYKEAVVSILDRADQWGRVVGAVNTIVKDRDRLVGHNTDSDGFIRSLKEAAGFVPKGRRVLMLGAGGAARAAAFGLAKERVASLTIANRTAERARSLSDALERTAKDVSTVPMESDQLRQAAADADLIVNCTSVGMSHGGAEGETLLDADMVPPGALVYDMVYALPETPLLREARKAGAATLGGLWMLVYQGAAAFELWIGKDAPVDVMFEAATQALAAQQEV